jgi:hypothetical protein
MIAFEVYINGKRECTAGIAGPAVLTAAVCWVLRHPAARGLRRKELSLGVGGLASRSDEFRDWSQRGLRVGDEVIVRIIETARVDKPKKRRRMRATPAQIRRRKQAHLKRLAKELGWKIQTK